MENVFFLYLYIFYFLTNDLINNMIAEFFKIILVLDSILNIF